MHRAIANFLKLYRLVIIIIVVFFYMIDHAEASSYNATTDRIQIVYAYQLSGQYGLLNRLLYYSLLIFSIAGQRRLWLITSALTSATTYSSTAAIHALILAASRHSLYDIDTMGV